MKLKKTSLLIFVIYLIIFLASVGRVWAVEHTVAPILAGSYDLIDKGNEINGISVSGDYAYATGTHKGFQIIDISNPAATSLVGSYGASVGSDNISGSASEMYVSGNYAYIADGGLDIINISNPAAPVLTGSYATSGGASDVYVQEKYAYVASGKKLLIIDISNPSSPSLAGSYDETERISYVYVSGSYAYITLPYAGLHIIDISNTTEPSLVGYYGSPGIEGRVEVLGNYAYILDMSKGLQVVDVSNPAETSLAGFYNTPGSMMKKIHILGNYAYIAGIGIKQGLHIVDISNPTAPSLAGSYNTPGKALDLRVLGNYVYVADSWEGIQIIKTINGDYISYRDSDKDGYGNPSDYTTGDSTPEGYVSNSDDCNDNDSNINPGVLEICGDGIDQDCTDRDLFCGPVLSVSFERGFGNDVFVSGNYAYVTGASSGFYVVDISDPTKSHIVGSYEVFGAYGVHVSGNYAYVASPSGLQILDVNDPTKPFLADSYIGAGATNDVYVSGNYAYVTSMSSGLQVLSISDHTKPSLVGGYPGPAESLYVSGNYAYVAGLYNYDNGESAFRDLKIIDISNPAAPSLVGSYTYNTKTEIGDIYVSGDYAYVACGNAELKIIDISNPAAPSLVGSYNKAMGRSKFGGVYVSGNNAYFADGRSSFNIINVTNKAEPILTASYDPHEPYFTPGLSFTASSVYVSGDYAYVNSSLGFQIIKIRGDKTVISYRDLDKDGYGDPNDSTSGGSIPEGYVDDNLDCNDNDSSIHPSASEICGDGIDQNCQEGDLFCGELFSLSLKNGFTGDVYVSENYAYVTGGHSGLYVVDISDPENPSLAGSYKGLGAKEVQVSGKYAYIASMYSGLQIVDISDPENPSLAGSYADELNTGAEDVYVLGDYAYVTSISSGFQIIDVKDPKNPSLVGGTPEPAKSVYISGNYAYVSEVYNYLEGGTALNIINISNPAAPSSAGSYNISGQILDISVSEGYAYVLVSDFMSGITALNIVDIGNSAAPFLAGSYDNGMGTLITGSVYLSGNYAYISDGHSIFSTIDITNKGEPTLYASYDPTGTYFTGTGIYVSGDYAYATVPFSGLNIIQINAYKAVTSYRDLDEDGYGDPNDSTTGDSIPEGYVGNKLDCNDNDSNINPGISEICGDGIDQDCDGEGLPCLTDADGDGYHDEVDDCDDNDNTIHPGATEICGSNIDQDCDGEKLFECPTYPQIEIITTTSEENNSTTVLVKTTDSDGTVESVTLFYRLIDSTGKYTEVKMSAANNWIHEVPGGHEYYIEARDSQGNISQSPKEIASGVVPSLGELGMLMLFVAFGVVFWKKKEAFSC